MSKTCFPTAPSLTFRGTEPVTNGRRESSKFGDNKTCAYVPTLLLKLSSYKLYEKQQFPSIKVYSNAYLTQSIDVTIEQLPPLSLEIAEGLAEDYQNHFA